MKTFEKLCKRFSRLFPGYEIYFDKLESYPGFYRVCITRLDFNIPAYYTFETCKQFAEWINGVILE